MKSHTDKNGRSWNYIKGSWVLETPDPKNFKFQPDIYLLGDPIVIETPKTSIVEIVCKCGCGRTFHSTSKIYYSKYCQTKKYKKTLK